jgi:hypothetical protein
MRSAPFVEPGDLARIFSLRPAPGERHADAEFEHGHVGCEPTSLRATTLRPEGIGWAGSDWAQGLVRGIIGLDLA